MYQRLGVRGFFASFFSVVNNSLQAAQILNSRSLEARQARGRRPNLEFLSS
jgi:hypothetical protein